MNYKRRFHPSQVQCPALPPGSAWVDLTPEALELLDADPMAPLATVLVPAEDTVMELGGGVTEKGDAMEGGTVTEGEEHEPDGEGLARSGAQAASGSVLVACRDAATVRAVGEELARASDAAADDTLCESMQVLSDGSLFALDALSPASQELITPGLRQFARALGAGLLARTLVDPAAVAHVWARAKQRAEHKRERRQAQRAAAMARRQALATVPPSALPQPAGTCTSTA